MTTLPFSPLGEPPAFPGKPLTPVNFPPLRYPANHTSRESVAAKLLRAFSTVLRRRRSRLILAEMDDFMLKDIGLTRAEAAQEADKPFWRE